MASYIKRQSVISGKTMYYAGDDHWVESYEDRKVYETELEATLIVQPTPGYLGGGNGNGTFKNASIINE